MEKNLYKVVNFFSSKNEDVSLITFNKEKFEKNLKKFLLSSNVRNFSRVFKKI